MGVVNTIDWEAVEAGMLGFGERVEAAMAKFMAARVRATAPVDTGAYVRSVYTSGGHVRAADNAIQVVGSFDTGDSASAVMVVVAVPYAFFVEYGHMSTGGEWVPPNPVMRNAMADTIGSFERIVNAEVFSLNKSKYYGSDNQLSEPQGWDEGTGTIRNAGADML